MRRIATLILVGLLLAGCQRETEGKPIELAGRLFVFNYRVARAYYELTLRKNETIAEGSVAEATFEDPSGGALMVVREPVFAASDRIVVQSPMIHCVVKDRPYKATIRLLGPAGEVLQTIDTTFVSDVDETILPAKPLVTGPFYTENPEMFPNGKLIDQPDPTKCFG